MLFSEASSSPKKMRPVVGCSSPAMRRSSVVLPEPEGPSRAISSPERISSETSWSAGKVSNSLRTLVTRTCMGSILSMSAGGGEFGAVAHFKERLQRQRHQRKAGQQRGDREGAGGVVVVVKDLDMQGHGVGLAPDVARHHGNGAEFAHGAG